MKKMVDMVEKARSEAAGKEHKKGGSTKPKKLAMGGVGKIRHEQATKSGKPLSKAEFKKKRI